MNLKNNTPRMHHISHHFEMKNSWIFWKAAQPLPRVPHSLTAYGSSILASSAFDLRSPLQCSSGVDAHGNLPTNLIFQPIAVEKLGAFLRLAHRPRTLSRPLIIKSAVCLATKEKLHSCSSVCLWHCNDSIQFCCTTPIVIWRRLHRINRTHCTRWVL